MTNESLREEAAAAMRRINQAWMEGRVDDLAPLMHEEIVMVFPGFAASGQGREALLAGFRDFVQNAAIREFRVQDQRVDVAGNTAVISFRFEMVYERAAARYRSTGRDLWIFQRKGGAWLAVWRTMLEVEETPA